MIPSSNQKLLRSRALAAGALVLLVLLAYWPALRAGWIWDDDLWVLNNVSLRSLAGLKAIWLQPASDPQYYPLTCTTFWIERAIWGLNPFGYHLDNLLLHAANAVLAWLVFKRLGLGSRASWLAAALFAVHPVGVESVAWITERKNTLSSFCFLLAMLAWFRFEDSRCRRDYACAFVLFLAALCGKTVTCSLPAVLLIAAWWRRGRVTRNEAALLLPFFAAGAAMGLGTAWIERHRVGALGPEWNFSIADRLLIAGRALWFYAGKLVWPDPLVFVYPRWILDPGSFRQWLYPCGVVAAGLGSWFGRRRWGRAPLAASVAFAVMLFPALGFINTYPMRYSFVADHFQYLACLALLGPAGFGLAAIPATIRRWAIPAVLAAGIFLSCLQCGAYRSPKLLWQDTLVKNPGAVIAYNNLALLLMEERHAGEAIALLGRALRIAPDDPEVHANLGLVLAKLGRLESAILEYRIALKLRPRFAEARNNLGSALASTGRTQEAIAEFRKAVEAAPGQASAQGNLGRALLLANDAKSAIPHLQCTVQLEPSNAEARRNLLDALRQAGRVEDAAAFERWSAAH